MKRSLHQRWSNIAVSVALAALVVVPVYAATTVGTNISTGGTLSVTGASTLTGAVTATGGIASGAGVTVPAAYALDAASTGVLNIGTTTATTINIGRSGQTQALLGNATVAGTLSVTGISTLTGNLGIGTSTPGTALGVTGAGVFTGPLTFTWLNATSTIATSTLSTGGLAVGTNQFIIQQTSGSVGIGTTTPSQLFSVHGNSYHSGTSFFGAAITATSTLNVTGLTTLGNASTSALSITGNLYVNGFATTTGANGNIATAGTLGVTGASTLTGGVTVGTGNAITGIIAGYCSFSDVTSFTASTTKYTDCTTTPTGALTTATRVFVQATSSLESMYVIQAASSTGVSTINIRILNTGLDGAADTTLGGTSINFWAFR